jgi:hypothetical protein
MSKHEVILASPPDRENLVAQISADREMWAEINHESDHFEIEFYPRKDGDPWIFSLDELLSAIENARKRLAERLLD